MILSTRSVSFALAFACVACGGETGNPFGEDASVNGDSAIGNDSALPMDGSLLDGTIAVDDATPDTFVFTCADPARPNLCNAPDRCVNFTNDRMNCGACGRTCGGNQICQNSSCVEPPMCGVGNNTCTGNTYCELQTMRCTPGCDGTRTDQCDATRSCMVSTHTCECRSGLRACGSACATCPSGANITSVACLGESCVVDSCAAGYARSTARTACEDINECLNSNACPSATTCVNQPGTFACECRQPNRMCGSSCVVCPNDANATATTCASNSCIIASCAAGYMLNQNGTACVAMSIGNFVFNQDVNVRPSGTSALGRSVSLSPDARTLVVGDINYNPNGSTTQPGAVHVYLRGSTSAAFGTAPNQTLFLADGLTFGQSSALSGNVLVVGDSNYATAGAVFVYTRTAGTEIFASNPTRIDAPVDTVDFGASVALTSDALVLAVGDPPRRTVHFYARATTSGTFVLQNALTVSTNTTNFFGFAVALTADGLTLAVGDRDAASAGVVQIFTRSDRSVAFASPSVETLSAPANSTDFGTSLSFAPDGLVLIVGDNSQTTGNGAVHVYTRANTTALFGTPTQTILRDVAAPNFGISVSLSSDTRVLAIGDNDSTAGTGTGTGIASIYTR